MVAQRLAVASALFGFAAASEPLPGLQARLQDIAQNVSGVYNCSISIAFKNGDGSSTAAYGPTEFGTDRQAQTTDNYAFGSCTKMLTGASILKLVSEGKFGLDDPVVPLVDPFLAKMASRDPSQSFKSMGDLWGDANVTNTTVRQLLQMTAGVPDFDTANPCFTPGCVPKDDLRKALYDVPGHGYSPKELMEVDWVKGQWHTCKSRHAGRTPFCYSSTNFMLLGMILADNAGVSSWEEFDQGEYLPSDLKDKFIFEKTGSPKDANVVHGYDRTKYNTGVVSNHDNYEVDGVFSGWTASDITGTAEAIAELTWAIHGPDHSIAPKEYAEMMIPSSSNIYGLAAHNLGSRTGQKSGGYEIGYGHLGATYGYQSITAYFPKLNFVVTVASNIETDQQTQPALGMCYAYNAAASIILGQEIHCKQSSGSYYSGGCECDQISSEDAVMV